MKKTIEPSDITAIVDTREQRPLDLSPLNVVKGTLDTGDYSVLGLEHVIAIERKSLADLVGSISRERERFDKACHRLLSYPVRGIVVEASWRCLEMPTWRGRVTPAAVQGSLLGYMALGIPIMMAHDHATAGRMISRLLYIAARRRWREMLPFLEAQGQVRPSQARTADRESAQLPCPLET